MIDIAVSNKTNQIKFQPLKIKPFSIFLITPNQTKSNQIFEGFDLIYSRAMSDYFIYRNK